MLYQRTNDRTETVGDLKVLSSYPLSSSSSSSGGNRDEQLYYEPDRNFPGLGGDSTDNILYCLIQAS